MKSKTRDMSIKTLADADVLRVPLLQHIGKPATPVVSAGDRIKQFQLIGQAAEGCSACIHSPVSGCVLRIENIQLPGGAKGQAVVIKNDHKNEQLPLQDSNMTVAKAIAAAGIVGEGGAQFPTNLKYDEADRGKIKTLILNGTECEPYLTADYALMQVHAQEIFKGAQLLSEDMQIPEIVLVIEEQNKSLIGKFQPLLDSGKFPGFRIQLLSNGYPQGGELQVIKSVTGMEVPRGKLPKEAGVIVNNVGTVYSVYRALVEHVPLVSRVITVSGEGADTIGNFEVKIGTSVSHILRQLHIQPEDFNVVLGGPMMGKIVYDLDVPIVKGTSGILLLPKMDYRRNHCIGCGYCVEACPMHLMPFKFEQLMRKHQYATLADYGLANCIECAACEFSCPSHVALIQSIKDGKLKLKEINDGKN